MNKKILLHSCCGPCSIMCIEQLQADNFAPIIYYYNPNIHPQKEYYLRLCAMQHVAEIYNTPLIVGANKEFFQSIIKIENYKQNNHNIEWIKNAHTKIFNPDELLKKAIQKILIKWQNYAELFQSKEFDKLCLYVNKIHINNPDISTLQSLLHIDSYAFVNYLANCKEKIRCKQCYKERMTKSIFYAKEQGFTEFTSSLLYSKFQDHDDICHAIEDAISLANKNVLHTPLLHFYYNDFRQLWQQGIDKSKELNIYRQKWCGCILSRLDSLEQMAMREYEKFKKRA